MSYKPPEKSLKSDQIYSEREETILHEYPVVWGGGDHLKPHLTIMVSCIPPVPGWGLVWCVMENI